MTTTLSQTPSPCRTVSAEEIAFYDEHGWVKLRGFLRPAIVQALLDRGIMLMGEDGASNEDFGIRQPYFNPFPCGGLDVPELKALLIAVAENAKLLMNRKCGTGVRYFFDTFVPKLPAGKASARGGNGPTSFHQDFITFAMDRSGGMQFWIPLQPCGPEKGTMSFINGSHKMGVLGNYTAYEGRDITEVWPELLDLEVSEPMTYELGDVTVHNHLTVHGAGANLSDTPRWALITSMLPADAHWNGAPPEAFDPSHLKPYQLLDEDRFPTLARGSD
ncbi:phytanoyl-CoA dioxygenase family protein [Haliea sp. E17]|uniref:phytanoyl-CoA dioxygenase family protein n=1 Tax=Haliea sp. E17 TaxID=3401576 RepID=UPI003AB0BAF0